MLPKPRYACVVVVTLVLLILGPWSRVPDELRHPKHVLQTDHTRLARPVDEAATRLDLTTPASLPFPSVASPGPGAMVCTEPTIAPAASLDFDTERRRREAVLALIRFPWQKLGYEIAFMGPRPGYRAMTISEKRRIEIYTRPGDSPMLMAYDLAHELGHAFDLDYNTTERRSRWRELRGIDPEAPWFGCNRCPDYNTPAGDFAETFALLLLGPGNYHSRMGLPPTKDQISELAAFCRIKRPKRISQPKNQMAQAGLPTNPPQ